VTEPDRADTRDGSDHSDRNDRRDGGDDYVVASEIAIAAESGPVLEAAFADRLREVENHDGFRRLEVWRDSRTPGRYLMVSWWRDAEAYRTYMRSDAHRRSHARIPDGPHQPKGVAVTLFEVVAR
jgi:heme-degrading monooxygenase HmoA